MRAPFGQVTSVEAVERFLARLNQGRDQSANLTRVRRRREAAEAAEYVQAALGLTGNDQKSEVRP
jgi:hypothetical protein